MKAISRRKFSSTVQKRGLFSRLNSNILNSAPRDFEVKDIKKPIGLQEQPFNVKKYKYGNNFLEMFDSKKTTQRSKELEIEFRQSGFHDLHVFKKTNGKLFLSPPSHWKAEKALYFPHMNGTRISDSLESNIEDTLKGKVSIVRMFSTDVGKKLIDSYFTDQKHNIDYLNDDLVLLKDENGKKPAQIVEINLAENWLKTTVIKMGMKKYLETVPSHRRDKAFISNREQLPFQVREQILANNLYTGYIFVIDEHLKIRWVACGEAEQKEFNLLWRCVNSLRVEQ